MAVKRVRLGFHSPSTQSKGEWESAHRPRRPAALRNWKRKGTETRRAPWTITVGRTGNNIAEQPLLPHGTAGRPHTLISKGSTFVEDNCALISFNRMIKKKKEKEKKSCLFLAPVGLTVGASSSLFSVIAA